MICPSCQKSETQVIDSRDDGRVVWRRRECILCRNRFTTYERIEVPRLLIVKRDGRRELFSKEKIISGIQKACQKRPVSLTDIEKIADSIEKKLHEIGKREIESKFIGEMLMRELEKLDKVAYIRFASVYRDFKSAKRFEEEIHRIIKA